MNTYASVNNENGRYIQFDDYLGAMLHKPGNSITVDFIGFGDGRDRDMEECPAFVRKQFGIPFAPKVTAKVVKQDFETPAFLRRRNIIARNV